MVKASLVKGSTTRTIGKRIAAWIATAGCGVMVYWNGGIYAAVVRIHHSGSVFIDVDDRWMVDVDECRIHRDTVRQIRSMIGV